MTEFKLKKPLYPDKLYLKRHFPLYKNALSQLFGENAISWYKEHGMLGHNGIDIPCPPGTPIMVAHDGKIMQTTIVDNGGGLGVKVVTNDVFKYKDRLAHFWTVYWHFERVDVKLGQQVKAGDVLGLGDNTGISTGSHLHFGLLPCYEQNNYYYKIESGNGYFGYIDPLPYINQIMKISREQLEKIYMLGFKRPLQASDEPYIGHELDFVLDELVKSKEHKVYKKLYEAGKEIEKL